MKKRIYGVIGISSIMSNWNADFTGYPKTTSNGQIFGSDNALKHPMRKIWNDSGEKVLYIKSMKVSKVKDTVSIIPRSLKERYEYIFNMSDLKNEKDMSVVYKNLFSAIDVKNFGVTFAETNNSISITGAVQIGQGFNIYDEAETEEQQVLSPFRDASEKPGRQDKGEARSTTIGVKIITPEAHYCYPFSINPLAYREYVELGLTEGYTEDDYSKFKYASLCSVTGYATNSKVGCENELALFVETEETFLLSNLDRYVTFNKKSDINEFVISIDGILKDRYDEVKNVEVYYNPCTTRVIIDYAGAKHYNIISKKEVRP